MWNSLSYALKCGNVRIDVVCAGLTYFTSHFKVSYKIMSVHFKCMLVILDKFHQPPVTHFTRFFIVPKMHAFSFRISRGHTQPHHCNIAKKIFWHHLDTRILSSFITCNRNCFTIKMVIQNMTIARARWCV